MCLYIDENSHKKLFGRYLPKRATKDILVYKILQEGYYTETSYFTPFQNERIVFKSGIAVQKVRKFGYDTRFAVINEGIHSCRTFSRLNGCTTFKAIIPKGTQYYVGVGYEMVSKELIIFQTEDAYEKYIQEHSSD